MMRTTKILISTLIILGIGFIGNACTTEATSATKNGSGQQEGVIAKNISVKEFNNGIKKDEKAIILDVRTPQEVTQGYISGAKNINFSDADFLDKLDHLEKDNPVYVYCRTGRRSGIAMNAMKDMGFTEVYNLSGGILAWAQQGLEIKH